MRPERAYFLDMPLACCDIAEFIKGLDEESF